MDLRSHALFLPLLAAFERQRKKARPWSGIVFRSVHPRHANRHDAASGKGSLAFGGRWNAPGTFAAVYASLDPETALAEALARIRREGLPDALAMPRTFLALEVRLERALDLSRGGLREPRRIARKEMVECDWLKLQDSGREALTQAMGRASFRAGFDGILVPSAGGPGGVNLVAMPENFGTGSRITPLGL